MAVRAGSALLTVTAALLGGCAALSEHRTGVLNGALRSCPPAPRCVSSGAAGERYRVAPLTVSGDPVVAWRALRVLVDAMPRTRVVEFDRRYLRAEVTSPWGVYVDDLELLRRAGGVIDVRSSARLGYYDFDVNRDRVEALRDALVAAGVGRR